MGFLSLKSAALAFLAAVGNTALVSAQEAEALKVMFVNEFPDTPIDLYWENHSLDDDHPERRKLEARIPPRGGWHSSETFNGHEFSYIVDGKRHFVTPPPGNVNGEQFLMVAGDTDGFRVRCEITVNSQQYMDYLDILVKPYWSPRGAARFLELVRDKYYDGAAFNRVVPKFLTQFGIGKDFATRTKERELTIWDDFPKDVKFEAGTMSFAGSGHDSRTTEIFIVMPGVDQAQLDKFGENSWETPFAIIEDVNKSGLKKIYSGYGDMPPFAKGPDSSKIYDADGYTTYLPKKFPKLDYIDRCYVVGEVGLGDDQSEGEF
mmetsp:Transcript_41878/g.76551  ORF Transcript_41878/g.76551 Transcript_41878/m.76551 type:complete len:319 (+) Transcript_41878:112-1068(+)